MRNDTHSSGPARRIGFDLSVLDRVKTGTSVYAENLFNALAAQAPADLQLVSLRAPRPLKRKNIVTKFINLGIEIAWLFVLLPLKARRQRLDLVHFPANIISPVLRGPRVCTIHDAHFITQPRGRDPLWRLYATWSFRYAARHAERIISDTQSGKREVVEHLGAEPADIEVVYLGLPHRESGQSDRDAVAGLKPYILTVGAMDPNKNLTAAVRAFARLQKDGAAAGHRLVLAGPAGRDLPVIEDIIRQENIAGRVSILGRVSDARLAALYEGASLFVFPSLCEGFGFPPLEAMDAGVPVVASRAPCIPETLGDAALYFDPHDIDEFAGRIQDVLTDEELRERLARAGQSRSRKFTWAETASRTLDIYRSLLEPAPAP